MATLEGDASVDVLGCRVALVGAPGTAPGGGMRAYVEWQNALLDQEAMARDRFVESPLVHPSVAMRTEALRRLGGWRDFDGPEDYDLWLRAFDVGLRFAKLAEALVEWHDSPRRLTRTDPRYAPGRFLALKLEVLARGPLAGGRAAVVWGAGPVGKSWSRTLRAAGHEVRAFVEVDPRKIGARIHGAPVVAVDEAGRLRGPAAPCRGRSEGGPGAHPRGSRPARPRGGSGPRRRRLGTGPGRAARYNRPCCDEPASAALSPSSSRAPPRPRSPRRSPACRRPRPASRSSATLLALEDARSPGAGELERLLRDPDRGVRRRAALAAGRVADPSLVPALVDLLNDQEVEVRRMAAFALGLAGERAAVDRLLAALADPDPGVRGRAAEALGRIGDPRAAAAIARLVVDALPKTISRMTVRGDDPGNPADSWAEQRLALFALARLKDVPAARHALLDGARPRFDWWAATWVAMRLECRELRPVLVAAVGSDDPRSRALAARGFGALKDASAVDLLLPLVRDPDETVALHALRALGAIGDARGTAAAAAMLAGASDVVRREALLALAVLPPTRRSVRASWGSSRSGTPGSVPPPSAPSPAPTVPTSPSFSRGWTPTPCGGCARRSPPPWATSGTR